MRLALSVAGIVSAVAMSLAVVWAARLPQVRALFDETRFNIVRWELTTFFNKWVYKLGEPFRDDPSDTEALVRYFDATARIAGIERGLDGEPDPAQAAELDHLREERRRMENHVEAIIEGRITSVLEDEGLATSLGPLPFDVVWPPVDFELTAPPRVLAVSEREHISLLSSDLLAPGLSQAQISALEHDATSRDQVGLVLSTSGVATYPSIIDETRTYESMVATAAHEWVHQYLAFHPLGRRYFTGSLRSVNETVATIAGRDLGRLVVERYPPPPEIAPHAPDTDLARIDLTSELRELRGEVDDLLATGKVEEAEALMRERRDQLASRGADLPLINQAYFAFRGLYATSGASSGDLGPKLEELRSRAGSVGDFLREVRRFDSLGDIDRALGRSES